jgi:hypothetical protein
MVDLTNFLTVMAALSTGVQTFVDHVIKGPWPWSRFLNGPNTNPRNEEIRQSAIHLISFVTAGFIALSVKLYPLKMLDLAGQQSAIANFLATGLLVSFGSSFFNEALDAMRAFKVAQEGVRAQQVKAGVVLPNVIS